MIVLFWMAWASICLAENIEYEIKERDSDRYILFVATFSNFIFLLFPNDHVPAFFTIAFINMVSTLPFYLIQKINLIYPSLKILTYLGFVTWLTFV